MQKAEGSLLLLAESSHTRLGAVVNAERRKRWRVPSAIGAIALWLKESRCARPLLNRYASVAGAPGGVWLHAYLGLLRR